MLENEIDLLIEQIAALQSKGEKFFPEGLFPAFRQNKLWGYHRADTNVFYSAVIVFTLNQIKENLSEKSQKIIKKITEKVQATYPKFQNKDGLSTYNFYETNPTNHFPNGLIFRHLRHFQLPDDIDDTAMIYLTSIHEKEAILWLKEKLKFHSSLPPDGRIKKVVNTFEHYRNLKVYSTWFGKNMPIEFDACALCNLMYWVFKENLSLNDYDHDTLHFLASIILNDEFINEPFRAAHNYATTPIIIYHYARLMADFHIPALEVCREKLINTIIQLLDNEKVMMNKVILESSLLKLNLQGSRLKVEGSKFEVQNQESKIQTHKPFRFFIAGLLSAYENPFLHFFADKKFTQIEWQCPAHNLTLLAENLALKKQFANPKIIDSFA